MSALANISSIAASPSQAADVALQRRWTIAWSCTRRRSALGGILERAVLVLDAHLRSGEEIEVDAWLEVDGARARSIRPMAACPCTAGIANGILGVDIVHASGERAAQPPILKLSIDLATQRLLYAQSSLLRTAGLGDGACDPPVLRIPFAR